MKNKSVFKIPSDNFDLLKITRLISKYVLIGLLIMTGGLVFSEEKPSPDILFLEPTASPDTKENSSTVTVRMKIQVDIRKITIRDKTEGVGNTNLIEFGDSHIDLSADWEDRVRAFVKLNLDHLFEYENINKIDFNSDFEIERFVENASIEFKEREGRPVAVLIGKQDVIFGLDDIKKFIPLPYSYWNGFQKRGGVLGITLASNDLNGLADRIEATVYEGERHDFDIEDRAAGFLLKLKKELGSTNLIASYGNQEYDHTRRTGTDETLTFSLETELSDKLNTWFEAGNLKFVSNAFNEVDWGISTGAKFKLSDDVSLVGSVIYIEDLTGEYGLALVLPNTFGSDFMKKNSTLSFQIYHSEYSDRPGWKPDTYIGFQFRINTDNLLKKI